MKVASKSQKIQSSLEQLKLSSRNNDLLYFLIDDIYNFDFFINNYWEGADRQLFSIHDFRCYKIKNLNLSFSEFASLFEDDKIKALGSLFQHPIKKTYINILETRFSTGLTLYDLFKLHKKHPEFFLQTHIL